MKPLVSPCHDVQVYVTVSGYNDDVTIWCSEETCYNTWDKDGNPE